VAEPVGEHSGRAHGRSGRVRYPYAVEYGLALLVHQAGEQLLRVAEDKGPRQDLSGRVEGAEAGDELAAHEQQTEERRDGPGGEFECGEGDRQAVQIRAVRCLLVRSGDYAVYILLLIRDIRVVNLAVDVNVDMIAPGDRLSGRIALSPSGHSVVAHRLGLELQFL
jgi:hypothetical protein